MLIVAVGLFWLLFGADGNMLMCIERTTPAKDQEDDLLLNVIAPKR